MAKNKKIKTFQEIIERLNSFWAKKGCIIAQPYGMEIGAGTANPQTFFRALGPEPYNVAYLEPSRRPDDGRYGENPNRLQHYFQYQVMLKPAPIHNQELYIEMLQEIGVDPKTHDLRFVEDNWESPAIGAWGLGWEVWLDGMEISQYTYFQQVAGLSLEEPALEITLGLERLAMYIFNVGDYRDIPWNEDITYGEMFEKHEYWQSLHNFETSNITDLKKLYTIYEKQIQEQLEKNNYWAGYDYLLKLSHVFNLLDSRRVVSISDRTAKFAQMGNFSKRIGELWLSERENMNYPLLDERKKIVVHGLDSVSIKSSNDKINDLYILELGLEELPSEYLSLWVKEFKETNNLRELLINDGLKFKKADLFFTPRRIVIQIQGPISLKQEEITVEGPPKSACYDSDGNPTKELEGFVKSKSSQMMDVQFVEQSGKCFASLTIVKKTSLQKIIENLLTKILKCAPSKKFMRWNSSKQSFIRPPRWLISFHNDKAIRINLPLFTINGDCSILNDNYTYTPRYSNPKRVLISSAFDYLAFIKQYNIILDQEKRRELIKKILYKDAKKYDYSSDIETYIEINTYMTESPRLKFVALDGKFKILPKELVTCVLEEHQKYLMRWSKNDQSNVEYGVCANLLDYNQDVIDGNKKVVKARLEDALFYFNKDRKRVLKELRSDLEKIVFHPKLGSYVDKISRLKQLVEHIYRDLLNKDLDKDLLLAFDLLKNDKATHLVAEFANLEGIVGMNYALEQGYSKNVSKILYEHNLPTSKTSALPSTLSTCYVSFADKLDNILALAYVGELPRGSNDPYEIRKQVYNLLRLIREKELNLDINHLLSYDLSLINSNPLDNSDKLLSDISSFINQRLYQIFRAEIENDRLSKGIAFAKTSNINSKFCLFGELKELAADKKKLDTILDTFKRITNILRNYSQTKGSNINQALIETKSERNLLDFVTQNTNKGLTAEGIHSLSIILEDFFRETMVNVENEKIRQNRLMILFDLNQIVQKVFVEQERSDTLEWQK
ncbi:glycine--tRNA ligase subunit beta [Patescibacteria group bacterium]|nr:glycine--tRNA ligase subunit beta [Patescibacteria group bacterium]